MKKFSDDIILSYINGDDVCDLESLENDYSFMISVINYCNDKKMYNLCSSGVKGNYEFVKFMITKFCDDTDFICDVYDNYMIYSDNEVEKVDLTIYFVDILKGKDEDKFFKYKICLVSFYSSYKLALDNVKASDVNDSLKMGMGFYAIFDDYYSSVSVCDFFAKNFINDIFYDNDINFDDLVHKRYDSYEKLEEYGVNNFLIGFLGEYDDLLADYVTTHLYLLDDLKRKLDNIKGNWGAYLERKNNMKYGLLYYRVSDYINKNKCLFIESDIIWIIAREFKMEDEICSYYSLNSEYLNLLYSDEEFNFKKLGFKEYKHYCDIRKIFCDIMFSENLSMYDDYVDDNKDGVVIDYKTKKKYRFN